MFVHKKAQHFCTSDIGNRIVFFLIHMDERSKPIQQTVKRMFLIFPNFIQ